MGMMMSATTHKSKSAARALFTLTDAAATRVQQMLETRGKPSAGIRVNTRTKGCNGNSYTLEFADKQIAHDEVVETHGIRIFIDPKAIMFVVGTEMDFVIDKLQSGFVFRNPNAKGYCGCGESFHV